MPRFLWNIQSAFYRVFRQNPLSARLLNDENKSAEILLSQINRDEIRAVLDIGSGVGNSLHLLTGFRAKTYSIDSSRFMLKRARPLFSGVVFIQADTRVIPFKKNSFQLISCLGVTEYLKDLHPALKEIRDSLDRGGYFLFSTSVPHVLNVFRNLFGHRIFIRDPETIRGILKELNFEILHQAGTTLQNQYLVKKNV